MGLADVSSERHPMHVPKHSNLSASTTVDPHHVAGLTLLTQREPLYPLPVSRIS